LVENRSAIIAALMRLGVVPAAPPEGERDRLATLEAAAWSRLSKKRTVAALETYLADFPDGAHARSAEEQLQRLRTRKPRWRRYGGFLPAAVGTLALLVLVYAFLTPTPSWGWLEYFLFSVGVAFLYLGIAILKDWAWKRPLGGIVCASALGAFLIGIVVTYGTTKLACDDPSITEAKLRSWWNRRHQFFWPTGTYHVRESTMVYDYCEVVTSRGDSAYFTPYNVLGFTWIRN
jgi:hypothetical protein